MYNPEKINTNPVRCLRWIKYLEWSHSEILEAKKTLVASVAIIITMIAPKKTTLSIMLYFLRMTWLVTNEVQKTKVKGLMVLIINPFKKKPDIFIGLR